MRLLKIAVLSVAMVTLTLAGVAQTPSGIQDEGKSIRSTAVLTTSDVLSTTFTLPQSVKAVHFFVNFTKGSLTNAVFAPAGAMTGNPASTGYYKCLGYAKTVDATGKYHIRVPREEFGAYRYAGLFTVGTGTATSSDALITAKYEY